MQDSYANIDKRYLPQIADRLMPGVRAFPLERLRLELARYNEVTGKRVVVQYLMLDGVNDQDVDFEALEGFQGGFRLLGTMR